MVTIHDHLAGKNLLHTTVELQKPTPPPYGPATHPSNRPSTPKALRLTPREPGTLQSALQCLPSLLRIAQPIPGEFLSPKLTLVSKTPSLDLKIHFKGFIWKHLHGWRYSLPPRCACASKILL